jgi:Ankyrin repeats (many copies)
MPMAATRHSGGIMSNTISFLSLSPYIFVFLTSCRSALRGDVVVMNYFKSTGLNFSILNSNGHSALHKAALKGHKEACIWLLSQSGTFPSYLDMLFPCLKSFFSDVHI